MRQPGRDSCRPFGTSDASSSPTTGSRPWLQLVVPPGLNHIPRNHMDYVLPMFSLVKILHGVGQRGEMMRHSPIPPLQGFPVRDCPIPGALPQAFTLRRVAAISIRKTSSSMTVLEY